MIKFMLEIKENNKVIANIPVDNIADTYYSILDQSTYTIRVYRQPQQCEVYFNLRDYDVY